MTAAALLATAAIACAGPAIAPPGMELESPVPASIGVAVRADGKRVVVSEVSESARNAGVEVGDAVIAYNGAAVSDVRQFERLVLETAPGSRASLQVLRDGALRVIDVPVHQIQTASIG